MQSLACPGDPHVRESSLLFQLLAVSERAHVWEDTVLHARQKDDGELQTLGRVQGHQSDDTAVFAGVGDLVTIGNQGNLLEEVGKSAVGGGIFELVRDRFELAQVLDTRLVLGVVRRLQLSQIARLVEHRLKHRGRARTGLDEGA